MMQPTPGSTTKRPPATRALPWILPRAPDGLDGLVRHQCQQSRAVEIDRAHVDRQLPVGQLEHAVKRPLGIDRAFRTASRHRRRS
jgi:hypothetical protein